MRTSYNSAAGQVQQITERNANGDVGLRPETKVPVSATPGGVT